MIDFDKFKQHFGMTRDDFLMFLEEIEQRLDDELPKLQSMLVNNELLELSGAAHKLKTPAATLGLADLSSLLAEIELNAKSEADADFLNQKMKKLERQYELFRLEFKKFKNEAV